MHKTYFIPIKSSSLAFYYSRGLILPTKYYENRPPDIQDKQENTILLSTQKWISNCDCSVEVVLTEDEVKELININEIFFQFKKPLPISRICKIYFTNKKQMDTTIWNVNYGSAFIPMEIVKIEDTTDSIIADNILKDDKLKEKKIWEFEKKISRFNAALGGFAFMKASSEEGFEYPYNYFSTLSLFNKQIDEQVTSAMKSLKLDFSKKYQGLFNVDDILWGKLQAYIYKNLDIKELKEIAEKENLSIQSKFGIVNLDSIVTNSYVYDLAVLFTYGEGKSKSTEDFLGFLKNSNLDLDKREELSLIFGLNSGYAKLRNRYKNGDYFIDIKFKLDSQLDYYIIESLYQYYFNNVKENYSFSYIDKFCFVREENELIEFNSYRILDRLIKVHKKKASSKSYWDIYSDKICEILVENSKQTIPKFLLNSFNDIEANNYFKELLKDTINNTVDEYLNYYTNSLENNKNVISADRNDYTKNSTVLPDSIPSIQSKDVNMFESYINTVDFENFNMTEIKAIARFLGVSNYKSFNKENIKELIAIIKNNKNIL